MPDSFYQTYDNAADAVVELGNQMVRGDDSIDVWDVASGMLAGAVEYWLFARQPCKLPSCEACEEVMTAQRRLRLILAEVEKTVEGADSNDQDRDAHTGAT
ncbi:MAG: hypothetical protein P8M26_02070 [Gammaproteobacteria bacterium]|nr:hypothetical protein [Gammaproteobacteria bacterium]